MRPSLPVPVNLRRQSHNGPNTRFKERCIHCCGSVRTCCERDCTHHDWQSKQSCNAIGPSILISEKTCLLEGNSRSCTQVIDLFCGMTCRWGSFFRSSLRVLGSSGSDNNVALFHRDHQIFLYILFLCLFSFQLLLESNRSFFPRVP